MDAFEKNQKWILKGSEPYIGKAPKIVGGFNYLAIFPTIRDNAVKFNDINLIISRGSDCLYSECDYL